MRSRLFTIFGLPVYGYGLMIGLGIVASLALNWRRARRASLREEDVTNVTMWTLLFGFLGAKVLFVLTVLPDFLRDPLPCLGSEGFVVYGGLLAGLLTVYLWCRRRRYAFLRWVDLLLPGIALAQSFGRVGCFLSGCCYGRETESPLGVVFPAGSMAPAGVRLLPTQLFSAGGDLLLCLALLWLDRREHRHGALTAAYMLLYGVGRFLIEYLRDDPRGSVGALSTSQFISLFIVCAGIALSILLKKGERPC